jgi:hypothetical protein
MADPLDAVIAQRAETYGVAPARLTRAYEELSRGRTLAECVHLGDSLLYAIAKQSHVVWDDEMSAAAARMYSEDMVAHVRERALDELSDPTDRALWLSVYVEAHASPFYRELHDDGTHGDVVRDGSGQYVEARWQCLASVTGAVIALEWDESEHPRDDHGRFTDGGGGDEDGGAHPGKGYSASARVDSKGVIHTTSVYDAQRALHENRKVELDQPEKVSVLLNKLGKAAESMIAKGQKAPTLNLCNVTVEGTSLFCAETKGIPRIEMPQLDDQQTKDFRAYLKEQGYKVKKDEVPASFLHATQNELNGIKVAGIADKLRAKPDHQGKRLIVSKDNYILDGHHHWAAKVGLDSEDGKLTNDTPMRISRVNISITKLLAEAEKFTGGKGKKGAEESTTGKIFECDVIEREWEFDDDAKKNT